MVLRPRLLASGFSLLQLPLKFAVAAASSRFNPRPPVIGQLLRGKKSTPWQPDKPIKSPAGVTAAALQTGVGWAEEQRPLAQVHSLGVDSSCQPPPSGYTDVHHPSSYPDPRSRVGERKRRWRSRGRGEEEEEKEEGCI